MERLLQIASETSTEVLADAASTAGEPAGDVVDAARFYVREILFHKGADAYRVLGLHRDASQAQVKAHYRLLQQWLHPDRQTSDWDAIFAARVNAAWSHLRSADRRRDYDQANPVLASEQAASAPPAVGWLRQPEYEQSIDHRARWGRRAPLVALVAVCGLLGALALLDSTDDPGRWKDRAAVESDAGSLHGLALSKPVPGDVVKPAATQPARTAMPRRTAARAPSMARAAVRKDAGDASRTAAIQSGSTPPTDIATTAARKRDPAPTIASTGHAPAERLTGTQAPKAEQAPAKVAASPAIATLPQRPPQQVADALVPAPTPAPAAGVAPPSANADPPKVSSEQALMAQRVGAQLMAYMNGVGAGTPPIWGSLTTQQGAAALRESLRAAGANGIINTPRWRVGSQEASLRADVRYQDGQAGRIAATLAWRDERWWVTALSMERDL